MKAEKVFNRLEYIFTNFRIIITQSMLDKRAFTNRIDFYIKV